MIPIGIQIDSRYEVLAELGQGGFGSVFKCRQPQLDRTVAIKILKTDLLQEHDGLARFEREAHAMSALKHKNIVGFYGFGVWGQAPYMVMELVDGVPLTDLIGPKGMDCLRAVALIKQVFDGLAAAHAAGVVHRDLKPSNIIVMNAGTENEHVKIIDFGLVKLMPGYGVPGQKLTETGYALGTCNYMAPEQALGGQVDQRADIYSCGCILYEMISGRRPFDADENVAVMFKHINEAAPAIESLVAPNEAYAESVQCLIDNCLVKDPSKRYQHCAEVLADISLLEKGGTSMVAPRAVPVANAGLANTTLKRKPKPVLLLAGTIILLGTLAGFSLWQLSAERKATDELTLKSSRDFLHDFDRVRPYTSDPVESREFRKQLVDILSRTLHKNEDDHLLSPDELTRIARMFIKYVDQPRLWTKEQREQLLPEIDRCIAIIRATPPTAFVNQFDRHSAQEDWIRATGYWHGNEQAVALKEQYMQAHFNPYFAVDLASHFANKGDSQHALELVGRDVEIGESQSGRYYPVDAMARYVCFAGDLNTFQHAPVKAATCYNKVLATNCGAALKQEAFTGLAYISLKNGKYKKALSDATAAINLRDAGTPSNQQTRPAAAYLIAMAAAIKLGDEPEFQRLKDSAIEWSDKLEGCWFGALYAERRDFSENIIKSSGHFKDLAEIYNERSRRIEQTKPEQS